MRARFFLISTSVLFSVATFTLVSMRAFPSAEGARAAVRETEYSVGEGRMRLLTAGDPSALPVLLLHGATYRAELWESLGTLSILADAGYYAVATDLPGHGKYAQTGLSRDEILFALINQSGLIRPVVIGHSLGGAYALSLIARHAVSLSGAVLSAPAKIKDYAAMVRGNSLPVLVLWGKEDRMIPVRHARELLSLFPNSRAVLLEGAQHESYQQKPKEFHAAILSFLGALSGSAAAPAGPQPTEPPPTASQSP